MERSAHKKWSDHLKTCEYCTDAVNVRHAEAKDIIDPEGWPKQFLNSCDEGRELVMRAILEDDEYMKQFPNSTIIY